MSVAEIEAELQKLTPQELRQIALKSWSAFVEKELGQSGSSDCDEDNPALLAALDEAIERARTAPRQGHSAAEVRSRLAKWTSK